MDCARYEELLFAGLDADPGPDERERMALHARSCARCRRLADVLAGNGDPVPADVADELAAAVFARTSGAAALAQLRQELPTLAEADPGADFISAVLAATHGSDVAAATPVSGQAPTAAPARTPMPIRAPARSRTFMRFDLSALWQRLVRRPRLALEGSYVVTMLALLVFGLPTWSAAESPVSAFDSWWRERTEAALEFIESASESAQRGLDSLWNETESGSVEPDTAE